MTAPVQGATVTAYSYDLARQEQGTPLGVSTATSAGGAFHIDFKGPAPEAVLLVARGANASYREPASGQTVSWDADTTLRGFMVARAGGSVVVGAQAAGTAQTLSPFTDLAVAFAQATRREAPAQGMATAIGRAYELMAEHLEVDFFATVPADLVVGAMSSWGGPAQFGLVLSGFSVLSERLEGASGMADSVALLDVLRQDSIAAPFDGRGPMGLLALGGCDACRLSDGTLRRGLADAMTDFLAMPANRSGLAAEQASGLISRIATRQSVLFGGDSAAVDLPPTLVLVDGSFTDDSGVTAMIVDGPGDPPYGHIVYVGTGQSVTLGSSPAVHFTKLATRYGAADSVPEVRALVMDDQAAPADIEVHAELGRQVGGDFMVVANAMVMPVDAPDHSWNRAIRLDGRLEPDLPLASGTYRLTISATDEHGHTSAPTVFEWTQTIVPPPVRQRPGVACDACTDTACPSYYTLASTKACPSQGGTDAADVVISGGGIPGFGLRAGSAFVDNPSELPLRVQFSGVAFVWPLATVQEADAEVTPLPQLPPPGCNEGQDPENADGSCFIGGAPGEVSMQSNPMPKVSVHFEVTLSGAAQPMIACSQCQPGTFQLPPRSTAVVSAMTGPWSFIFPGAERVGKRTGVVENRWFECDRNGRTCTWRAYDRGTYLNQVVVGVQPSVQAAVAPVSDWATFSAPGDSFNYTGNNWNTMEDAQ
jgi:hypothetical protein